MNRLRRIPKPVLDWAVPAVFLPWVLLDMAQNAAFADHRALGFVCALGFILPFGFRRRWPLGALLVAWAFCALGSATAASFFNLESPFPLVLYSAYIAGMTPVLWKSLAGLGVVLAGLVVVNLTYPDSVPSDYFFPGGFVTAMWLGSRTIRNRTLLAAELHEAAAAAEERRELAAALAVAEERRRIAREMHDLVGHSVSVMVVQAGGARRILDKDPDRAVEAAVRIEATGRAALAEMRRLLGILGAGDGDMAFHPQPTLEAIGPLVQRANDAGLRATLHIDGDRRPLPAGAEVAAYRVVQEALTNTLKHAGPAQSDVLLRWHPDALEIVVADRGPVPGRRHGDTAELPSGGHGIVGMHERVKVYGGELSANPRPDGGFVVRARIPFGQGELVAA